MEITGKLAATVLQLRTMETSKVAMVRGQQEVKDKKLVRRLSRNSKKLKPTRKSMADSRNPFSKRINLKTHLTTSRYLSPNTQVKNSLHLEKRSYQRKK